MSWGRDEKEAINILRQSTLIKNNNVCKFLEIFTLINVTLINVTLINVTLINVTLIMNHALHNNLPERLFESGDVLLS